MMMFVEETVDKICVHLYSTIINKNQIKLSLVWTFLLLTFNTPMRVDKCPPYHDDVLPSMLGQRTNRKSVSRA